MALSPLDSALAALRARSLPPAYTDAHDRGPVGSIVGAPPRPGVPAPTIKIAPPPAPAWWQTSMTQQQLDAEANRQADAALASQAAPINSARAQAAAAALRDEQALRGVGDAGAQLMQGIGGRIQGGYQAAAQDMSGMAAGYSAETAARVKAAQDASAAFMASQAPGASAPQGVDAAHLQDTLYALGGFIPGGSLETQGASANRWGQVLPAIEQVTTQNNIGSRMGQQATDDKQYEQQLIDLAAKRPDLLNQINDALLQREQNKLSARLNVRQESLAETKQRQDYALSQRQASVQERAETLYEKQFGEKSAVDAAKVQQTQQRLNQEAASLGIKDAQLKRQLAKDASTGKQIDAPASRLTGTIVYKDGTVTNIPVTATPTAADKQKAFRYAVGASKSLRGMPKANPKVSALTPGKYLADPSQPYGVPGGVFPPKGALPATTNDPSKALRSNSMTFADAQTYLQNRYGITRADARRALVAAGWKP
jgi:hypothetical protein